MRVSITPGLTLLLTHAHTKNYDFYAIIRGIVDRRELLYKEILRLTALLIVTIIDINSKAH